MPLVYRLSQDAHLEIENIRLHIDTSSMSDEEIHLDLRALQMLDSMLIGQLVRLQQHCQKLRRPVRLTNMNMQARVAIHHSNLDSLFGLEMKRSALESGEITSF